MKKIKNYQSFLESMEFSQSPSESGPENEVAIVFPRPIKIHDKIYKDTDDIEKDYHIRSMTNFGGEITINGESLEDWVESMNMSGEVEETEEDEGMEGEACDECD